MSKPVTFSSLFRNFFISIPHSFSASLVGLSLVCAFHEPSTVGMKAWNLMMVGMCCSAWAVPLDSSGMEPRAFTPMEWSDCGTPPLLTPALTVRRKQRRLNVLRYPD